MQNLYSLHNQLVKGKEEGDGKNIAKGLTDDVKKQIFGDNTVNEHGDKDLIYKNLSFNDATFNNKTNSGGLKRKKLKKTRFNMYGGIGEQEQNQNQRQEELQEQNQRQNQRQVQEEVQGQVQGQNQGVQKTSMKELLKQLDNPNIEFKEKNDLLNKYNPDSKDKKLIEELKKWFESIENNNFVKYYNSTNEASKNPTVQRLKKTIKEDPVHSGELGKGKIDSLEKLRNAYYTAKTSEFIENVDISTEDMIIFIIYIFVLRGISLFLLKWMIEINMVTTLEEALMAYAGVYLLLFLITLSLVNINTVDMTDIVSNVLYVFEDNS